MLVAWRSRRATLIRLLAPFVFLVLALIINLSLEANNSQTARLRETDVGVEVPIASVPPCYDDLFIGSGKRCYDFVYTPKGDPEFDVSGIERGGGGRMREGGGEDEREADDDDDGANRKRARRRGGREQEGGTLPHKNTRAHPRYLHSPLNQPTTSLTKHQTILKKTTQTITKPSPNHHNQQ